MSQYKSASVRVFLFTYRRNNLLPRAIESLINQSYSDWICELHNDDPDDAFPRDLVKRYNDPRILYKKHEKNLGGVRSFNLAFDEITEDYVSILEDDNWWEVDFLTTMIAELNNNPNINIAWANMWLSHEDKTGNWTREKTIWPYIENESNKIFITPHPQQVCGCLHSNGAMLLRKNASPYLKIPPSLPFFIIEPVRERGFFGPLLLVTKPLANFAITNETARKETADENMKMLVILAMTFFSFASVDKTFYKETWKATRGSLGHKHRALLVAAILSKRSLDIISAAHIGDIIIVLAWAFRHPIRFKNLFSAEKTHPEIYNYLSAATASLAQEWRKNF